MRSVAVQWLWKLEPIINYENETMGENGAQLKSPHLRGFAAGMEACCKNTFLFTLLRIHVKCFSLTPSVFFIWALPEIMTAAHWASSTATTGAHFWQLVCGFIQLIFFWGGEEVLLKWNSESDCWISLLLRALVCLIICQELFLGIRIQWKPNFKISTVTIKRIWSLMIAKEKSFSHINFANLETS